MPDVSDVDDLPVVVGGGNGDRILANLRGDVFVYLDAQDLEHVETCRDAEGRRVGVEKQERMFHRADGQVKLTCADAVEQRQDSDGSAEVCRDGRVDAVRLLQQDKLSITQEQDRKSRVTHNTGDPMPTPTFYF